MIKRIIIFGFALCLITSCSKEEISSEPKLVHVKFVHDTYTTDWHFGYDSKRRLIEKSNLIFNDTISYTNQHISKCIRYLPWHGGFWEEEFFYTNKLMDSITFNYSGSLNGRDLVKYTYENNKYIKSVSFWNNDTIGISTNYKYNELDLIEEAVIISKTQSYTIPIDMSTT